MSRKRRGHTSAGYTDSQKTKQTPDTNSSGPNTSTTAPKKIKERLNPGRTVSLHNLHPAVTNADISALIHPISFASFKRTLNSNASEPSEIAFLLLHSIEDATRVFLQLDGTQVMGQVVRANFVNGIKFEGKIVEKSTCNIPEIQTRRDDSKCYQNTGGTKGNRCTAIVKVIYPPKGFEKPKAGCWYKKLFSWRR